MQRPPKYALRYLWYSYAKCVPELGEVRPGTAVVQASTCWEGGAPGQRPPRYALYCSWYSKCVPETGKVRRGTGGVLASTRRERAVPEQSSWHERNLLNAENAAIRRRRALCHYHQTHNTSHECPGSAVSSKPPREGG